MAADPVEIPTRSDLESYSAVIELDGRAYTYSMVWSFRAGAWFLTLGDADGNPLLSGARVVVDTPLLNRFKDENFPPGELFAYDTSSQHVDPGLTEMSRRVRLLYYSVGDV